MRNRKEKKRKNENRPKLILKRSLKSYRFQNRIPDEQLILKQSSNTFVDAFFSSNEFFGPNVDGLGGHGLATVRFGSVRGKTVPVHASSGSHWFTINVQNE